MPVERRSRRLFVLTLAVPIIVLAYLATFAGRVWALLRSPVALALGATVIGSVYVEEAWRRSPAPRVSPVRAAAVLALALVVAGAGMPAAPTRAASPSEAAIAAAQGYLGTPYRLGATGPARFDCSGLMFRIFADIGELPRIGGKRMRAVQYYNWFKARGMISTKPSGGDRGDLVYYASSSHIGIYLGNGKVLSAMASGVKVHGLQSISSRFVAFLKVDWSEGDPGTGGEGQKPKKPKKPKNEAPPEKKPGDGDTSTEEPEAPANGPRGLATGTMNLRNNADPNARIIGWVRRGSSFEILATGNSPSGALWYQVKARNGKTGWVWSRWVQPLNN
ncbi:MAG TPA: NlpC/P60 family protein [Candidatus Limnocylindrales bacterium]|nr:NlpC/P60 family protein [Candidatus Limnocylindrales bacterium]